MEDDKTLEQPEDTKIQNAEDAKTQSPQQEADNEKELKESILGSKIEKFRTTDELETAYKNLEAEFTKKCQELANVKAEKEIQPETVTKEIRETIIKEYLQNVKNAAPVTLSLGGAGQTMSSSKPAPKTLTEAGELIKQLLQ